MCEENECWRCSPSGDVIPTAPPPVSRLPYVGHLASLLHSLTKTLVQKECQALSVFYPLISDKSHPKSCPENWAAQAKKAQAPVALDSNLNWDPRASWGVSAVGEQSPIPKAGKYFEILVYLFASPKYHFEHPRLSFYLSPQEGRPLDILTLGSKI